MLTPLSICYILICLINVFYDNVKFIWLIFAIFLLIPVEYNDVISYLINEYLLQIITFTIISVILLGYKEYVRASIFCFATIMSCVYLYVTLFVSYLDFIDQKGISESKSIGGSEKSGSTLVCVC